MRPETVDGDVVSLALIGSCRGVCCWYVTWYAATAPPVVGALQIIWMELDEGEFAETDVQGPGAVVVTGATATEMTNVSVSESPSSSVTVYVTVVEPALVGVPEITREEVLNESPEGNGDAL